MITRNNFNKIFYLLWKGFSYKDWWYNDVFILLVIFYVLSIWVCFELMYLLFYLQWYVSLFKNITAITLGRKLPYIQYVLLKNLFQNLTINSLFVFYTYILCITWLKWSQEKTQSNTNSKSCMQSVSRRVIQRKNLFREFKWSWIGYFEGLKKKLSFPHFYSIAVTSSRNRISMLESKLPQKLDIWQELGPLVTEVPLEV